MKTAVITGGAGGLGRASAELLIKNGWRVYSLDLSRGPELDGLTQLRCDMRSEADVADCFEHVKAEAGRVSLLASFAGIYSMALFSELGEGDYKAFLDVNLLGPWRLNKIFLPILRGRIIIVTSELAATDALPFTGLYALSKTALDSYADSLRFELSLVGIPVIAVRPGAFATSLTGRAEAELERICAENSGFSAGAERFRRIVKSQTGSAKPPEKLARVILRAACAKRPRAVYRSNNSLGLKLLSALPKRAQVYIIKKLLTA